MIWLKQNWLTVLLISVLLLPAISFAHPGRTDSVGCHTCRTNCPNWGLFYGEYHCHRSKGLPQPLEPVRSIRDQQITVPAPEYEGSIIESPKTDIKEKKEDITIQDNPNRASEVELVVTATKKEGWFKRFLRAVGILSSHEQ